VTVSSGNLSYPEPIVDKRSAQTTLLIDSGQTVVLGGLRKKNVNKTVNKVPLLGDIPLICYLFRFEGEDTVNSEMLVFITPKIVTDSSLSDLEKKQYEVTEFPGPAIELTRAEKDATAGKSDK
jgi:type II secretory pathway component GspD/PulD (secretin)